jgi:hypothetical protein
MAGGGEIVARCTLEVPVFCWMIPARAAAGLCTGLSGERGVGSCSGSGSGSGCDGARGRAGIVGAVSSGISM